VLVTVRGLPQATLLSSKNEMCAPFCSDFKINIAQNNLAPVKSVYFVNPNGSFLDSLRTLCFNVGQTKTITINYVDTNSCVNSSSLVINARPQPVADFVFDPPQPKSSKDLIVFTHLSSPSPITEWSWTFENNSKISKEKNPSYIFEKANHYPVVLVVKNQWGCTDTIIKLVIVGDEMTLYVPNVFTPNNDGKNDVFQPAGVGFEKYDLTIFDVWGHKVFNSNDITDTWDGMINSELGKSETYIWIIQVTSVSGKEIKREGRVTILR